MPGLADMLQTAEAAHLAARLVWLHPEDPELVDIARERFAECRIDYDSQVAQFREATGANAATARRWAAEQLRHAADQIYEQLATPLPAPGTPPATCPDTLPHWVVGE